MTKRITRLADLMPDKANANKGTDRGRSLLQKSLEECGAGRSIVADKDGEIVVGNKTAEAAAKLGLPVRVVETDGRELVVVQRTDLDLTEGGKARRLAYLDNRTGELGLEWDAEQIAADIAAGLQLGDLWTEFELHGGQWKGEAVDPSQAWAGMPEFEQEGMKPYQSIIIHFITEDDVKKFAQLVNQTITEKTRYLWFPVKRPRDLKPYRVADEP